MFRTQVQPPLLLRPVGGSVMFSNHVWSLREIEAIVVQ